MEMFAEVGFRPMRMRLWKAINEKLPIDAQVLEVGVGTGKNIPYWPTSKRMTAIDLTPKMLQRAVGKAQTHNRQAQFEIGDAQTLQFVFSP
jgi:ubiquinone/menaquinone biosynthesis C-methylase UbiE